MGFINYGGPGINLGLRGLTTNAISLAAGAIYTVPAGPYWVTPGAYTFIQFKDPITGEWRLHAPLGSVPTFITSDGSNYRVANLTGCVIGARLTNAGSGYTSQPTVTFSAGGATATAIMGQVVSTTVTITNGGANYTYAPTVLVSPPPFGGLPAKATASLTNGVVTSITITDQGAGYGAGPNGVIASLNQPTLTIIPNPEDPNLISTTNPITPATATVIMDPTSAGTVTAVLVTSPGTPQTSVPTIAFSGGGGTGAAATSLMAFAVTAQTVSGGSGYTAPANYQTSGGVLTTAAAYTTTYNPLVVPRQASGIVNLSGGALSSVTLVDNGLFQAVPSALVLTSGTSSIGTIATPTVGGVTDSFVIQGF